MALFLGWVALGLSRHSISNSTGIPTCTERCNVLCHTLFALSPWSDSPMSGNGRYPLSSRSPFTIFDLVISDSFSNEPNLLKAILCMAKEAVIHSFWSVAWLLKGLRGNLELLAPKIKRQLCVYPAIVFSSFFSLAPYERGFRFSLFVSNIAYG